MPTKIEWTQETWNPVTGCTKVSEGCRNCYAERMARRLAGRYGYPEAPHHFDVTLHPDRLTRPLRWKKPRTVFVCSMSDLSHEGIDRQFRRYVFDIMVGCRQHTFQVLTKRPQNIMPFWYHYSRYVLTGTPDGLTYTDRDSPMDWPENTWLGVSIENQETADERREYLRQCPAAVKFVSYEPALSNVDWTGWEFVDQIISGGESGPGARPSHPDWHRATRDFCQEHSIAYFFKQWGRWLPAKEPSRGYFEGAHLWGDGWSAIEVGKKAAGRLLDGREWNEMPK